MKNLLKFFLFGIFLLLVACAANRKSDWVVAGPSFNRVKPENVEVFDFGKEIKRQWGIIGFIYSKYISIKDNDTIRKEIKNAREIAAQNGASAIIVKKTNVDSESAYASDEYLKTPHIYLYITAIKYVDKLTKEEKNAVEKWKTKTANMPK